MQTLLPFPDFERSARALDARRLGKQRVECLVPRWLGDPEFHRSHQSALLRKDPVHYGPLFPGVPDDLPYVWPEP